MISHEQMAGDDYSELQTSKLCSIFLRNLTASMYACMTWTVKWQPIHVLAVMHQQISTYNTYEVNTVKLYLPFRFLEFQAWRDKWWAINIRGCARKVQVSQHEKDLRDDIWSRIKKKYCTAQSLTLAARTAVGRLHSQDCIIQVYWAWN